MGKRRGLLQHVDYGDDGTIYAEFLVPTRGMLGFRQPFLTNTRGTGIFNTLFDDYELMSGPIDSRALGSLVALESGAVSAYALEHLQQRGTFFVKPTDEVYSGQIVGENIRTDDLVLNVCRAKHLTGHRAVPKGIAEGLSPARIMSLDEAIEYLGPDDLLEITPASLRLRKGELRHEVRQRAAKAAKKA